MSATEYMSNSEYTAYTFHALAAEGGYCCAGAAAGGDCKHSMAAEDYSSPLLANLEECTQAASNCSCGQGLDHCWDCWDSTAIMLKPQAGWDPIIQRPCPPFFFLQDGASERIYNTEFNRLSNLVDYWFHQSQLDSGSAHTDRKLWEAQKDLKAFLGSRPHNIDRDTGHQFLEISDAG